MIREKSYCYHSLDPLLLRENRLITWQAADYEKCSSFHSGTEQRVTAYQRKSLCLLALSNNPAETEFILLFFFVSILSHPTRDSFWQWSCNRIPKRLRDQSLDATSKLRAECSLREFNTTSTTFAFQPAHALTDAWQEHDTDGIHSKPALAVCSEQHPPATQTRFFFPVYLSYIFIYMYTYAYFRNGDDTWYITSAKRHKSTSTNCHHVWGWDQWDGGEVKGHDDRGPRRTQAAAGLMRTERGSDLQLGSQHARLKLHECLRWLPLTLHSHCTCLCHLRSIQNLALARMDTFTFRS